MELHNTGGNPPKFFLSFKEKKLLMALVALYIPCPSKIGESRIAKKIDENLGGANEGIRYNGDPWKGIFYKEGLKVLAQWLDGRPLAINGMIIDGIKDDFLLRFLASARRDILSIYYCQPLPWGSLDDKKFPKQNK